MRSLRTRLEALEEHATRVNCPSLVTVSVYEGDNASAVDRWAASLEEKWPDALVLLVNHCCPRPAHDRLGVLNPERVTWG